MNFLQNLSIDFPMIGIFSAIILLLGLYHIGHLIFKIKIIRKIFNEISNTKYQKIFIAINFVLLIFYPLILYSNTKYLILCIGLFIYLLGIYKCFLVIGKVINYQNITNIKYDKKDQFFVYLTLFSLFFLSL